MSSARLAASVRELARQLHALRNEPAYGAVAAHELLRRVALLEAQCPGNPDNPLRRWLGNIRIELEVEIDLQRLTRPTVGGHRPPPARLRPVSTGR